MQRFSSASFPRPSHITRSVNCEKQMFSKAFFSYPSPRKTRTGGKKKKISFKQIFLPALLTLQSQGVSYQQQQIVSCQLQPSPSRCPRSLHSPLQAAAPRLRPRRWVPSGLRGAEPACSLPSPVPSLRSSPGRRGQPAGGCCSAEGTAQLLPPAPPAPAPPGERSPQPGPHRPLQEQQQQHFARSHPIPERAG